MEHMLNFATLFLTGFTAAFSAIYLFLWLEKREAQRQHLEQTRRWTRLIAELQEIDTQAVEKQKQLQ